MSNALSPLRDQQTAIGRWAGMGPYYAMFPLDFAYNVINEHTEKGDAVLDPFAGRASSIYAACALGRTGTGIEINPVGWLYGSVKLYPADLCKVLSRIEEIGILAEATSDEAVKSLPPFFRHCYTENVLRFLLTARCQLNWKQSPVDSTLMALILVDLHGKKGSALSAQMRQGKAMSPDYSIAWWQTHGENPPDIDPVKFMKAKANRRYAKGAPKFEDGKIKRGDSVHLIPQLHHSRQARRGYKLLFTSPPYYSLTNYHKDQWLRIWMLGGNDKPSCNGYGKWQKRFESREEYKSLLQSVFTASSKVLASDAKVFIRTDARQFTLDTTVEVLSSVFPSKTLSQVARPYSKPSQTALFGDKTDKPGEVDLLLC